MGGAGHHQDVAGPHQCLRQRVLEVFAGALDADDGHAKARPHVGVGQGLVVGEGGGAQLGDGKAVVELDEVHHPARDQVRHALAHVHLGIHHVVGADALGDLAVFGRERLDPDVLDTEFGQHHQRHQAAGQVGADADDGVRELGHAQLAQHAGVGGVGLHCVGELVGPQLHQVGVAVDAHDVVAHAHQRLGHRTAEAPQADDNHAVVAGKRELL